MTDQFKDKVFVPGSTVSVSREELVGIVKRAYYSINMQNSTGEKFIQKAFDTCGLNPWSNDTNTFYKHLGSLSENGI